MRSLLPFQLVASDLDGTLLNAQHIVGDFTIDTLRKLEQKHVDIVLATGRKHEDVFSIVKKIGIENIQIITSNGARIHDLSGKLLYKNDLPVDLALDIMNTPFDQ
ncbi:HAD family hydrolase, partial [Gallibacterium sp. AGMB14963]|uniref:HAD family hydrolase n=1 Tax=Gallibacterium faecale TaxID=3019086 RepID=UPI0022F154BB